MFFKTILLHSSNDYLTEKELYSLVIVIYVFIIFYSAMLPTVNMTLGMAER